MWRANHSACSPQQSSSHFSVLPPTPLRVALQAVNTEVNAFCVHHMAGEYNKLLQQVMAGRGELARQTNSELR